MGQKTVQTYDLVVVGLGAMGSSALWQAARRGLRVLGIEQFPDVPHERGSHHGHTRIIRQAYFEDPAYVPFVLRAYDLWRELEEETGTSLLVETGGLMIGHPLTDVVAGALKAARLHNLACEEWMGDELAARFRPFSLAQDEVAVFEPHAGYLYAEKAVRAAFGSAGRLGAQAWLGTKVKSFRETGDGVEIVTDQGSALAARMILTVGAWAPEMASARQFSVERQVCFWFEPAAADLRELPIFLATSGVTTIYGFPYLDGHGLKVAFHHAGAVTTPETVDRQVASQEIEAMQAAVAQRIPALQGARLLKASVCLYTNTPDFHFAIGPHPVYECVTVGLGFSGHGFKFASAVGELLVGLACGDPGVFAPAIFDPRRILGTLPSQG